MKNDKVIIKFNNGNGCVLCSKCYVILRTGNTMTIEDKQAMIGEISMDAQYCWKCNQLNKVNELQKRLDNIKKKSIRKDHAKQLIINILSN